MSLPDPHVDAPELYGPTISHDSDLLDEDTLDLRAYFGVLARNGVTPRIALDFDNTLHRMEGWSEEPDGDPVDGAREFCEWASEQGYELVIYTCREDPTTVAAWLEEHGFPEMSVSDSKPKALLYVDDRGWRFDGDWGPLYELLEDEPGSAFEVAAAGVEPPPQLLQAVTAAALQMFGMQVVQYAQRQQAGLKADLQKHVDDRAAQGLDPDPRIWDFYSKDLARVAELIQMAQADAGGPPPYGDEAGYRILKTDAWSAWDWTQETEWDWAGGIDDPTFDPGIGRGVVVYMNVGGEGGSYFNKSDFTITFGLPWIDSAWSYTNIRDEIPNVAYHETQHYAQYAVSLYQGLPEPVGLPPRDVRNDEVSPSGVPADYQGRGTGGEGDPRVPHSLRDVEFWTDLRDQAADIVKDMKLYPPREWGWYLRQNLGDKGSPMSERGPYARRDPLRVMFEQDPARWQAAVPRFLKLVQDQLTPEEWRDVARNMGLGEDPLAARAASVRQALAGVQEALCLTASC